VSQVFLEQLANLHVIQAGWVWERRNCQCSYSWTVLEGSTGQGRLWAAVAVASVQNNKRCLSLLTLLVRGIQMVIRWGCTLWCSHSVKDGRAASGRDGRVWSPGWWRPRARKSMYDALGLLCQVSGSFMSNPSCGEGLFLERLFFFLVLNPHS